MNFGNKWECQYIEITTCSYELCRCLLSSCFMSINVKVLILMNWTFFLFDFYCESIYVFIFGYWPHIGGGFGSNKTSLSPLTFCTCLKSEIFYQWFVLVVLYKFSLLIQFRLLDMVCFHWFIHALTFRCHLDFTILCRNILSLLKTIGLTLDILF